MSNFKALKFSIIFLSSVFILNNQVHADNFCNKVNMLVKGSGSENFKDIKMGESTIINNKIYWQANINLIGKCYIYQYKDDGNNFAYYQCDINGERSDITNRSGVMMKNIKDCVQGQLEFNTKDKFLKVRKNNLVIASLYIYENPVHYELSF